MCEFTALPLERVRVFVGAPYSRGGFRKVRNMLDTTLTAQVRDLRNSSLLALLSAVTVMCIGYAAPAGAFEKGKIVEVPASTVRAMTPAQQEQAKA